MDFESQDYQLIAQVLPCVAMQLRGTLGNMRAALKDSDEMENCVLRQNYYRLLRTVTNLTDAAMLAEDAPLPKQDTELVTFFDELCRQAQPPIECQGLTLHTEWKVPHLTAGINREYTSRILWNLLSNAVKFTPAGGKICVSLSQRGGQVILSVSDTGCGIAPEMQETICDRILHTERIDPLPHGLGLGLVLCRCFAQRQGGTLLIRSGQEGGTCVMVSFPATRCGVSAVQDIPFHYAGGFQPVMMELADALSYSAFENKHLD